VSAKIAPRELLVGSLPGAIIKVLERCGPLTPQEIRREVKQDGWGYPPITSVNTALRDQLKTLVVQCGKNEWRLVRQQSKSEAQGNAANRFWSQALDKDTKTRS
jgi:hypothetical protein